MQAGHKVDEGVVMEAGCTHIQAPVPGRPTFLAASCGHCRVSEAMGIDPDCAHLEPAGGKADIVEKNRKL